MSKPSKTLSAACSDTPASLRLRGLMLTLALIAGTVIGAMTPGLACAASLRTISTVEDDVIRLGDIFEGLRHESSAVLGASPVPGKDMVLNARTLMRIASAYNLEWRPQSAADQVVIRRSATIVTADQMQTALRDALAERGYEGNYDVVLNQTNPIMTLPGSATAAVDVQSLTIGPDQRTFEAVLVGPSKQNPLQQVTLNGQIQHMIDVPVIKSALKTGDIIGSNDITFVKMAEHMVTADAIVDADRLIGMTPVRGLSMNKLVRARDVSAPMLVSRGDEVTIVFQNGPIQLTAKGKAMQNGVAGENIRVTNAASNRSFLGTVTDSKVITVQ